MDQIYVIRQGWTIIFAWGPHREGRICCRTVPSCGSRSKSRFIATAPIFTMRSWRKFQILRFSWMLLRPTENVVAGHIWPGIRYLPTCIIRYWQNTWKCKRVVRYTSANASLPCVSGINDWDILLGINVTWSAATLCTYSTKKIASNLGDKLNTVKCTVR